jgi:hypothetical protein
VNSWLSTFSRPVALLGEVPPLVLTRGVWAGGQRYGVVLWSSDIQSSFEQLTSMVPQGVHASLSGVPWWTTDVCVWAAHSPRLWPRSLSSNAHPFFRAPTQPPPPSLTPAAQALPQPLTAPEASVNSLPVPTPSQPRATALVASPISSNSATASSPTNPRLPPPTNTPSIPGGPASVNPALLALQRRDLNRDGKINIVELRLWLGSKADLKAWDQNGDQELDRQEFQAFFEANPNR